jgi:hypothetical protein
MSGGIDDPWHLLWTSTANLIQPYPICRLEASIGRKLFDRKIL